jgi:mRNA-degrading endonuclease toxin of MazEF toxin-antitoxin module
MSHYVSVKSVCGNASTEIDMYDLELNRDGVICCDNCKSILICRNAWNELYKENK